jgi:hypothetical protein
MMKMYTLIYKEESGYDLKVEKLHGVDQVAVVSNIKIIHGLPGKLNKILGVKCQRRSNIYILKPFVL